MKKKAFSIVTMVFLVGALLAGCASKGTQQTGATAAAKTDGGKKKVIGISVSGFSAPYFKALIAAAEAEAKKQNVELKILDGEFDTQKQASQVESLISQKVDLIEIIPADSTAIIPTMKKVKDAGIPQIVVNTQNDPSTDDLILSFVGASMEDEATMAAESIKKILSKGGNVVMIEGAAGSFPAIHRSSGFEAAIKDRPDIKIVAKQNAGWDRAKAMATMEDFLTRFPKIDALYAHDDNMAIGAIQALKAAGRLKDVPVISISGTIEGYAAVTSGEIYSTVSQPPDWEGMMAVQAAVKALNGEKLEKWIKTPIAQVTKDNVSQFKGVW
jgi:ribose transport system substrate-binding protein